MSIKINDSDISNSNIDIFGDWLNSNLEINKYPFKHCIINNFLKDEIYEKIYNDFPNKIDNEFWEYSNPLEVKYVLDKKRYDFL